MSKKLRYHTLLFIIVISFSCGIRTVLLKDGKTKVPLHSKAYLNKSKFTTSVLNRIDTAALYEEFDKRYNILSRLDNHIENSFYGAYKFYSNGCVNYFVLDRDSLARENDFNPLYSGYRGVYYEVNGFIKVDLFAEINGVGSIGKLQESILIKGDTLYVKEFKATSEGIYIKQKKIAPLVNYRGNW
jgi:hypothetical protein